MTPAPKLYNMIVYDSRLFFDRATPDVRAKEFGRKVVGYLMHPGAQVIVLADGEVAEAILPHTLEAGFYQFSQPYEIKDVIDAVESCC